MPSNKNRDKQKAERTGKNEVIHYTVCINPEVKKDGTVLYKIVKLGFTISEKHASIVSTEEVAVAKSELSAFSKFQAEVVKCGALDIKHLRKLVHELKEENEKKAKS